MLGPIFENFHYAVVIILMMVGLYTVFAARNLIKKLVGLSVFQTSVFLLYITIAKVDGAQPPILVKDYDKDHAGGMVSNKLAGGETAVGGYGGYAVDALYSNPLPHVLILTAIVVGVATLAVGLALVVRVREVYGSIEEDEINRLDYRYNIDGIDD